MPLSSCDHRRNGVARYPKGISCPSLAVSISEELQDLFVFGQLSPPFNESGTIAVNLLYGVALYIGTPSHSERLCQSEQVALNIGFTGSGEPE